MRFANALKSAACLSVGLIVTGCAVRVRPATVTYTAPEVVVERPIVDVVVSRPVIVERRNEVIVNRPVVVERRPVIVEKGRNHFRAQIICRRSEPRAHGKNDQAQDPGK